VSELLAAAADFPVLVAALVVIGGLLYLAERLFALSGPMSRLVRSWRNRELARLRRDALIRAEKRRLQMEEESAVMADLRAQVRELTGEVARLRSVVRASEAHHRVMRDWADGLLRTARSSGVQYVDPPPTDEQPAIPTPAPAPA
jgi:pimeloyl-ACP methyl ester carboxylesterase